MSTVRKWRRICRYIIIWFLYAFVPACVCLKMVIVMQNDSHQITCTYMCVDVHAIRICRHTMPAHFALDIHRRTLFMSGTYMHLRHLFIHNEGGQAFWN